MGGLEQICLRSMNLAPTLRIVLFSMVCLLAMACSSTTKTSETDTALPILAQSSSATFALTPAVSATPISLYTEIEHRELYRTLYTAESTGYLDWDEEYQMALEQNAIWLTNAQEVAIRFLPTIYGEWSALRARVYRLPATSGEAAFIIIERVWDDSVGLIKYRLELTQRGEIWKINWIGWMRRCRRGSDELQANWHTQACP